MSAVLKPLLSAAPDIPTLAEELEDRALAQLERLHRHHQQGKLTDAQFSAAVDTLFQVCNGLVSEELFKLVSALKVKAPERMESRLFFGKTSQAAVFVEREDDRLVVQNFGWVEDAQTWSGRIQVKLYSDATIPEKATKEAFERLCQRLLDAEYYEV